MQTHTKLHQDLNHTETAIKTSTVKHTCWISTFYICKLC